MIRAVITDCYGTLYPDPVLAYRHDGRTPTHVVAALQDIHDRAAAGAITKPMYIERAARLLRLSAEEAEHIFFGSQERNLPLLAYLATLRPACKVAMLTNASQGVVDSLFSAEERQVLFDAIIETHRVQTPKPDPAIYRWACQQLGVEPAEAVAIDDRPENVAAARALGMQVVQYHDFEQTKAELEVIMDNSNSAAAGF